MKRLLGLGAVLAAAAAMGTTGASAQGSDTAFLQCMMNCAQWGDPQIIAQCEAWCYSQFNPN